ncbi:MAG: MBL fold metallo-hydrolase [Brevibacillus sp.]|nr:MBL fold metallo-hydrolase [Brevibacillus sp.]
MQITTLGYWGAYPSANEATSGYLLQAGGHNILLDCGSGVLAQLQNHIPLERLDAVCLSHYHADHLADLFCLQYATMILMKTGKRTKPLDIYAHEEDREMFDKLTFGSYCQAHPISADSSVTIGGASFSFARTTHPVPCLAMRIEYGGRVIGYTADTEWNEEVVQLCDQADLLLAECNLYDEQYGAVRGHLTAGEAGKLAAQTKAGKLILTHLPHYGDHQQLIRLAAASYKGPIELACTGKQDKVG